MDVPVPSFLRVCDRVGGGRGRWRKKRSWRCSTRPSTGSSTPAGAPSANAALSWRAAAKTGGTFAHGEQELHPSTLRAAERGRASAADHGCSHEGDRGAAGGCVDATVPGISCQLWRSYHRGACRRKLLR